jgi:hypothetical protein
MDLDLDLDNYKLSELLNIYQLSSLPSSEIVIDDIYNNRVNNSNISTEIKNFLNNIKIRLKMEVREKNKEKAEKIKKKEKKETKEKEKTRSVYLCIDSRFRNNYYKTNSNDFIIDLPYEFNNVIKMGLMSIEIINSTTTLSGKSQNNKFDISYNSSDISDNTTHRVIVEDGNFSASDFQTEINKDLDDAYGSGHIELIFNKNTGKTVIQSLDPDGYFNLYLGENKQEPFNTLGYMMGFRKKEYKHQYKLESEALFNLTGENYFFLYVDDYNCNYYKDTIISVQSNDYLTKNILGRITMGGDKYQIVYEDTSDLIKKERIYSGPINLKKLHIKLLNVYGNIANINEMDYSIIFEIIQKTTS